MEVFNSNSVPRLIPEEELLRTQTEGDRQGRHERIERINKKLEESAIELQSSLDEDGVQNLSADQLWDCASIYAEGVASIDLDTKFNDGSLGTESLKEKIPIFWKQLDKVLVQVAKNAIAKNDQSTLYKIAAIYYLRGDRADLKYQEYSGNLHERVAKQVASQKPIS